MSIASMYNIRNGDKRKSKIRTPVPNNRLLLSMMAPSKRTQTNVEKNLLA